MLINKNGVNIEYINVYSLSLKKIKIPFFQRFYSWSEKQIEQLKMDIKGVINGSNKDIYLLDFIYYEEDNSICLADGQQRLVTLNLLIKAIKDYSKEQTLIIDDIDYFNLEYEDERNNKIYKDNFDKYLKHTFKKIYLNFYKFVETYKNNINLIIDVIKYKIFIFIKKVDNADDAFSIFTQINTGGKPLTKEEVLKSVIEQYALKFNVPIKITDMKDFSKSFTNYHKILSNSNSRYESFNNISIFKFLRENIINSKENLENFEFYLKYVHAYDNNPMCFVIKYLGRPSLRLIWEALIYKKVNLNYSKEYIEKFLFPLCLISIGLTINKANPGGIVKSFFEEIFSNIKKLKENEISPEYLENMLINLLNREDYKDVCTFSYETFVNGLGSSSLSDKIKEALLIMDIINSNFSSTLNVENVNLEHIFPQKPCTEWYIHGWPTHGNDETIHNIGNCMLLCEKVNKRIQNKYITEKKEEYIRIYNKDRALQTSINSINYDEFENNRKDYILKRQKYIVSCVYNNFELAQLIIKK